MIWNISEWNVHTQVAFEWHTDKIIISNPANQCQNSSSLANYRLLREWMLIPRQGNRNGLGLMYACSKISHGKRKCNPSILTADAELGFFSWLGDMLRGARGMRLQGNNSQLSVLFYELCFTPSWCYCETWSVFSCTALASLCFHYRIYIYRCHNFSHFEKYRKLQTFF